MLHQRHILLNSKVQSDGMNVKYLNSVAKKLALEGIQTFINIEMQGTTVQIVKQYGYDGVSMRVLGVNELLPEEIKVLLNYLELFE